MHGGFVCACYANLDLHDNKLGLNKEICNENTNLINDITQSRLWKGRHHHDDHDCSHDLKNHPALQQTLNSQKEIVQ